MKPVRDIMQSINVSETVSIGSIGGLHSQILDCLSRPGSVAIDGSVLKSADFTLVQLLISASKTVAGTDRTVRLTGSNDAVRKTFERCGVATTVIDQILAA